MRKLGNVELQIAEKTTDQLLAMVEQPEDWLPDVVEAARIELGHRGAVPPAVIAAPIPTESKANDLGSLVLATVCADRSRLVFLFGVTVIGSAFVAILLFVLMIPELSRSERLDFLLVGTLGLTLGAGILRWAKKRTPRLYVHENGVKRIEGKEGREVALLFNQIGRFTYDAARNLVNGIYSHTTVDMKFEPVNKDKDTIAATVIYRKKWTDQALGRLREGLATTIADRMEQELREGRSVLWTGVWSTQELRSVFIFQPSGLEVRATKGNCQGVIIPFDEISGYNVLNGVLQLYSSRLLKPAAVKAGATNFYPGYVLLFRLAKIPAAPFSFWEKLIGTR